VDRIPVGGRDFPTPPFGPWGPPSLLYNGYRVSFTLVKRGRGVVLTHVAPRVRKSRATLTLLPIRAFTVRHKVNFTLYSVNSGNDISNPPELFSSYQAVSGISSTTDVMARSPLQSLTATYEVYHAQEGTLHSYIRFSPINTLFVLFATINTELLLRRPTLQAKSKNELKNSCYGFQWHPA